MGSAPSDSMQDGSSRRDIFWTNLESIYKVDAHRDLHEEGISERRRSLRQGNFYADVSAKEGA
eukprot:19561-Pyramimonas_sp.AAC.1